LQACVAAHAPADQNYALLVKFLTCTWDAANEISSLEMLKECLDQAGASGAVRTAIEACAAPGSAEADSLMRASAATVKARGVQRSCTVFVEGAKRCVRDGGRWYDCPGGSSEAELLSSICDAYKKKTGRDAPEGACSPPAAAAADSSAGGG
jgi:hypothetical protein